MLFSFFSLCFGQIVCMLALMYEKLKYCFDEIFKRDVKLDLISNPPVD